MRLTMLLLMMASPVACIRSWLTVLKDSFTPCVRTDCSPGTDVYRKDSLCGSENRLKTDTSICYYLD
ncbi:unnamed protein product [Hymenolepis diminuta]|uniref:Uncharacterized protein n=1 Tax=Hymenolepis diminuta TaxID=6216 RepID=A0A564Y025_HYMDI|nr:unnamed protein product [Hymenolepis diminuta]